VPFALRSADAQKTDADLRKIVDAVGKVVVAFGGNASNLLSNPAGTIATMESTAKNLLEMQKRFRVIGITGNLSFGNSSTTRQLVISNTGFDRLVVSGITYPSGFSGSWSGTIAAGATQNVTIKFTPTASVAYSGNITIASDATSGSGVIAVSGSGVNATTSNSVMVIVQGGTLPSSSQLAGQKVATFQIGKYETTWGEWKSVRDWAVANKKGYDLAGVGGTYPEGSGDNFPVINVSWYDVVKWCNARSEKEGKTPVYKNGNGTTYKTGEVAPTVNASANGYRLPSDKEWEWAARGGVSSKGYTYSGSDDVSEVSWIYDNSPDGTKAVGMKAANELGVYDVSGNAWEWCWDIHDPNTTSRRVRGGSWSIDSYRANVSFCGSAYSNRRDVDYGFRAACSSGN
jgi:formylglycine-generating enzyme required for sulfatase activity